MSRCGKTGKKAKKYRRIWLPYRKMLKIMKCSNSLLKRETKVSLRKKLKNLNSKLFYPESTMKTMPCSQFTQARVGRKLWTGQRCFCACIRDTPKKTDGILK